MLVVISRELVFRSAKRDEERNGPDQFHYLKVPYSYFQENRDNFDIRSTGDKFDLHISAKKYSWLVCERGSGICFREFEQ